MSTSLCLDEGAGYLRPPLMRAWDGTERPLPVRAIRRPARTLALAVDAPGWLETGPVDQPFDFCGHMRRLCADVAARCPDLEHIDVNRLLFGVTQARSSKAHGLQARVTPMRFAGGTMARRRRGTVYQIQRYFVDGAEMLYLVTFCLPRFQDLDFDEKFVTLFHELYHIGAAFDGDLRRHEGRYCVHSHSQREYDRQMAALAREYLAGRPDPALHAFLRLSFAQLQARHGAVIGVVVPRPRLIPSPLA